MSDDNFVPGVALVSDDGQTDYQEWVSANEYLNAQETSNRIQYLSQAAPYLADDPEVLSTLAQMPIATDQLGYMAGSISAQMRLEGTMEDLMRMDEGRARAVYNQLTPTQQEALRTMGYTPPSTEEETPGPNWLNEVPGGGLAVQGLATAMGGLNTAITQTPVVKDVFDIFNKLSNGMSTLYRNIRTDEQAELATIAGVVAGIGVAASPFTGGLSLGVTALASGSAALLAGNAVAIATNPSDYLETTHDNWNGESVFSGDSQTRARQLLKTSGLDTMARDIAWEIDPYETVKLFASTPDASGTQSMVMSFERILDRIVEPGDPRRPELHKKLQQLVAIPEFREAVEALQNGKYSFGRDVANLMHMDPGTTEYRLVSGGLDAMFTIVMDPTLVGTKAFMWRRAIRTGVPMRAGADAFEVITAIEKKADEIPQIGNAYDILADAVNRDAPGILWRKSPGLSTLYDDLWNYKQLKIEQAKGWKPTPNSGTNKVLGTEDAWDGTFRRQDIFAWMHEAHNYERMLAGHGVKQGYGRLMLPTYGWSIPLAKIVPGIDDVTVSVRKPWEAVQETINIMDDVGNRRHAERVAREWSKRNPGKAIPTMDVASNLDGALRYTAAADSEWNTVRKFVDWVAQFPMVDKIVGSTGAIANSFLTMMPASRSISMVGPQAADDIKALVGLGRTVGMTSIERQHWYANIMQQDNIEHRMNAAMSYLKTLLEAGGASDTEEGALLLGKFIEKMKHRYSLGTASQFMFGERVVPRGLHPYQHTFDLPIPNLKEFRQYAEKGIMAKYVFRAMDSNAAEVAIHKMWKPLVILRVGFILRAGGEELLAHLARAGPSSLLAEFGARSIAEGRLYASGQEAARVLGDTLDPRAVEAIERMRYVAHVRPLEHMFSNWNWSRPMVDVLGRYSNWVRHGLEQGLFPNLENALPESRRLMVLGKQGGFRNALLAGADPNIVRYAESFGRVHAASIMKEVSSHNANFWAKQGASMPDDFKIRWEDPSGELQEMGFVSERGNFKVYRSGEDQFDRMLHASLHNLLGDKVTGEVYLKLSSRFVPDTITDDEITELVSLYRSIDDGRTQGILDELLTNNDQRTIAWKERMASFERSEPEAYRDLGEYMRGAHGNTIGGTEAHANAVLDSYEKWIQSTYYSPRSPSGLTPTGDKLMYEAAQARNVVARMNAMGDVERAWFGQHLHVWGKEPNTMPIIRDFAEYKRELVERLIDRHYDAEVQPLVKGMSYGSHLTDGTMVATPPREGFTRLWVPQISAEAYGSMIRELATTGPEQFAQFVIAKWLEAQGNFSGLHVSQVEEIIRRHINRIAGEKPSTLIAHVQDVVDAQNHGNLIPLTEMGYDNDEVARIVSQFMEAIFRRPATATGEMVMSQRLANATPQVALLDVNDTIRHYTPMDVDGVRRPAAHQAYRDEYGVIEPEQHIHVDDVDDVIPAVYGRTGRTPLPTERIVHSWALDRRALTPRTVSMADKKRIQMPDGTYQYGADPREALRAGAERMADDFVSLIGSGVQQTRVVKGVAYYDAHQFKQIPIGERLNIRDEVFDAKGNRLDYDNPDVFLLEDPKPGGSLHENWTMLGPLMRDSYDMHIGHPLMMTDTRDIKNLPAHVRAERGEAAAGEMKKYRAHHTHVYDLANPPELAVGPMRVPKLAPSRYDRFLNWSFEGHIAPALDAIVRRPMAFHHYAEAMQENERALRWTLSTHLFGDENRGIIGELENRFGAMLSHPNAQIDMAAAAEQIRTATRLMMPDNYTAMDELTDAEVVNVFLGSYADDVILKGSLEQQVRAAERSVDKIRRTAVERAWEQPGANRTVDQLFAQTRKPQLKRIWQMPDGRWTARSATGKGTAYLDVAPDRVSSILVSLNGPNQRDYMRVWDEFGRPTKYKKGDKLPPTAIPGPTWEKVRDAAIQWAHTGIKPPQFKNFHTVYGARLRVDYDDIIGPMATTEKYGEYTLAEWDEAVAAGYATANQPRWALPIYQNQRPVEGILDAYEQQLGEALLKPWGQAQRYIKALPAEMRAALPLDANSWAVLSASYRSRSKMQETIESLAADRAIRNTMPYLDSHEIRSQAGEYMRGFFPFMYAEQNFLKRWARTLTVAPDALRKGQLVYMGLKSGGVIRTDSQGRDWFVYPGAGMAAEVMNRTLKMFGIGEVLPTGVVFASQPQTMLPGFDVERTGMASAQPLVAMPVGWLASNFHELRPLQEAVVGKAGVAQGGVQQFVPTTFRRLWTVFQSSESNVQYASATISAAAILQHNGHGLPEGATTQQLDDYLRRLRNHTRGILLTQAFVGFTTPGSPSIQFSGKSSMSSENVTGVGVEIPADVFRAEYLALIQELGIEDGFIAYAGQHPDMDIEQLMAYTVGQSTSVSGAPLPATAVAVKWADENEGWIEQYPNAAAWMLPQPDDTDKNFDEYAYVQQTISGMRRRRTPREFMEALMFKEGGLEYFKSKEKHDRLMDEAGDNDQRRRYLQLVWDEYATNHKALHPIFKDQLEAGLSRERRNKVLDELRIAIADPSTPAVPHGAALKDMVETFDLYKSMLAKMSESRRAEDIAMTNRWKTSYDNIMTNFLIRHPELEPFWLSVLRPEASL